MAIEKFRAIGWENTTAITTGPSSSSALARAWDIEFTPVHEMPELLHQKGGHYSTPLISTGTTTPGDQDYVAASTLSFKTYLTEIGDGTAILHNESMNALLFYLLLGGEFSPTNVTAVTPNTDTPGTPEIIITGSDVTAKIPPGGCVGVTGTVAADTLILPIKASAFSIDTTITPLWDYTTDLTGASATLIPATTYYVRDTLPANEFIAFEIVNDNPVGSTYDNVVQLAGCIPTACKITIEPGQPPVCEWTLSVAKYTRLTSAGTPATSGFNASGVPTIPITELSTFENEPLPATNLLSFYSRTPATPGDAGVSWAATDFANIEIEINKPVAAKRSISAASGIAAWEQTGMEVSVTLKPYYSEYFHTDYMTQARVGLAIAGPSRAAITGSGQKWCIVLPSMTITEAPELTEANEILTNDVTLKAVYCLMEGSSAVASARNHATQPVDSEIKIHFI